MSSRIANGLTANRHQRGRPSEPARSKQLEWLVSYYGTAKTGAVVNPLSSRLTPDEVRYSVIDAGARAVIASSDAEKAHSDSSRLQRRFGQPPP